MHINSLQVLGTVPHILLCTFFIAIHCVTHVACLLTSDFVVRLFHL